MNYPKYSGSGRAECGRQSEKSSRGLHHHFMKLLSEGDYGVAGSVFLETSDTRTRINATESAVSNLLKLSGPICSQYHVLVADCTHTMNGSLRIEIVKVRDNRTSLMLAPTSSGTKNGSESEIRALCDSLRNMHICDDDYVTQESIIYQTSSSTFEILGSPHIIQMGAEIDLMTQVSVALRQQNLIFDDIRIILLAGVDLDGAIGDWALLRSMTKSGKTLKNGCPLLQHAVDPASFKPKPSMGIMDSVLFISNRLLKALELGFDSKIFTDVLGIQKSAMWFFDSGFNHVCCKTKQPLKMYLQLTNGPEDVGASDVSPRKSKATTTGSSRFVGRHERPVCDSDDDPVLHKKIRTDASSDVAELSSPRDLLAQAPQDQEDELVIPGLKRFVVEEPVHASKRIRPSIETKAVQEEISLANLLAKRTLDVLSEEMPRKLARARREEVQTQQPEPTHTAMESNHRRLQHVGQDSESFSPLAVAY